MGDDFSDAVKKALASRVGTRSSNPDCRALTRPRTWRIQGHSPEGHVRSKRTGSRPLATEQAEPRMGELIAEVLGREDILAGCGKSAFSE
jgi:hypothetical protein